MYNVNVAGKRSSVTSFSAAREAVRELATSVAESLLRTDVNSLRKIYRSPKAARRVAEARTLQASRIINDNSKLPAKAGSYSGRLASLNWNITRA